MCGDFDSVIGVDVEEPLNRFLTGIANGRFTPAEGEATLCGVAIETDPRTGLVTRLSAGADWRRRWRRRRRSSEVRLHICCGLRL